MYRVVRQAIPTPIYRALRRHRIRWKIAHFPDREVEHEYSGYRLRLRLPDPLAEGWYDHDWGTQPEIEALKSGRLAPGARVFDIGAHQGLIALVLARIVGSRGFVLAVEAEPHNVRAAEVNKHLNAADNLTVLSAAITDKPGTVYFTEGLNGSILPGGRAGKIPVDGVTLDALSRKFGVPDVVLLDVEGFEQRALVGGQSLLDAGATDWFVEIHEAGTIGAVGDSAAEVIDEFTRRGYRCLYAPAPAGPVEAPLEPLVAADPTNGQRAYLVAFGPASDA